MLRLVAVIMYVFFFLVAPPPPEIYTLSLHDALPISDIHGPTIVFELHEQTGVPRRSWGAGLRSEEHTSELQSHSDLVCRLLLEKKKGVRRQIVRPTKTLPRIVERAKVEATADSIYIR